MSDHLLKVESVSKNFGGLKALDEVSVEIQAGEVHAIVGENGAGKSTLMKILGGVHAMDAGRITLEGEQVAFADPAQAIAKGIAVIYQELSLMPHLSITENIFSGRLQTRFGRVLWAENHRRAQELLRRVGVDFPAKTPVEKLSISNRQLVEIAKALSLNARLVIMDEPNSSLSSEETRRLFEIIRGLKEQGITVIYISHKLEEVFEISDRISVMRDGKCTATHAIADITPTQAVEKMVGREIQEYRRKVVKNEEVVLSLRGLCGIGFENVDLELHRGEVLGLGGLVGAGRSELARAIFGAEPFHRGEMSYCGKSTKFHLPREAIRAGVCMVPEDRKGLSLFMQLPIRFNVNLAAQASGTSPFVDHRAAKSRVDEYRETLAIKMSSAIQPVSDLSGGNQQKTILARWLSLDPELLILDEPTHGIDVGAKAEIYHLIDELSAKGMSILLISSELPELIALSDRIGVMHEGHLERIFEGPDYKEEEIMACATRVHSVGFNT